MKRLLTIILLAVAAMSATAQPLRVEGLSSNQRVLGYTLTDDIDVRGAAFGEADTYAIGAALPPSVLASYAGCKIVGIRIAAALNLGRTRCFVYNFTGAAFEPVFEQKQRIYEDWNNVFFNGDGYEIKGDETLFFGFDYVETQAMVDAEEGGICSVGEETDGAFYLYGDYGQGEGLYSISGVGKLCVQLIVDVSALPRHVLSMTSLDTGFKYKKAGQTEDVMASFTNTGRDTISTYQLGWQIDNQKPVIMDFDTPLPDGQSETSIFSVSLPADMSVGLHSLTVFVNSVNGQEPDDRQHDRLTRNFAIYENSLQRSKCYFEVYTDQHSPYAPFLNDALKVLQNDMGEMTTIVNVHRPGTPLAVGDAAYLCDLYAYTYPSFTVNRAYFPGEAYVAYDMNDYLPVIPAEMSAGIIGDMILQDYYNPAFASVELTGEYDEATRQLTVDATGELLPEAKAIYGDMALTLLISEDGVKSPQAVYNSVTQRTSTNQNYVHDHVLRTFITAPTGQPLSATDGKYTARFTTTLDASWAADKLTVTALLTKATDDISAESIYDMDVVDACSLPFSDIKPAQGIGSLTQDRRQQPAVYYSVDGKRMMPHQLRQGIYLRQTSDGRVKKVLVR